jgi:hypothetical protein
MELAVVKLTSKLSYGGIVAILFQPGRVNFLPGYEGLAGAMRYL